MRMRYTNPGVKDALLPAGSVLTGKDISRTGTAVAWCNADFVDLKDLGFEEYPSELWIRWDAYYYSYYRGRVNVRFDDSEGNTGIVADNNNYYWVNGTSLGKTKSGWNIASNAINTCVMHVSGESFEVYVNGELQQFYQSGLPLGKEITRVQVQTGNCRYSNLIIANYDCSKETLAEPEPELMTISCDTERKVTGQTLIEGDARRHIGRMVEVPSNTGRTVQQTISLAGNTSRVVAENIRMVSMEGDTSRALLREVSLAGDTGRSLGRNLLLEGDTKRIAVSMISFSADTCRTLHEGVFSVSFAGDTARALRREVIISAGAGRTVIGQTVIRSDTWRILPMTFFADTLRKVSRTVEASADSTRKIPHQMGDHRGTGVQSITMTLAENTLSDTFQMTGVTPIYPKDVVEGTLLDFPYRFQAEETHEEGILHTVQRSMYDADKMLYTPIKYSLSGFEMEDFTSRGGQSIRGYSASCHAKRVASALELETVFQGQDFFPRENYAGTETTYQSVLSGLFGWTANVPRMLFNIFIRRGKLYFLQRGYEHGVIDLSEMRWYSRPTYDRKLIRTTWSQASDDLPGGIGMVSRGIYFVEKNDKAPKPEEDGVTASYETVPREGGRSDSRIRYTERKNPDGSTTRADYEYIDTGKDYLIRQITEVTAFPSGEVAKTRITKYTYTPDGWRHMVVWENNEVVEESEEHSGASEGASDTPMETGSVAYRGRPGDAGNEHLEEQTALAHGGAWKKSGTSKGSSFLSGADIPVKDMETARAYLFEMEWMDRCIEETAHVTLTAPVRNGVVEEKGNHVMDFFDRYLLEGKEYFLASNTVSLTPRSLKQNLTLVRWYK